MLQHNFLTYSGKIIVNLTGEILYFPVWWYSVGLWRLLKGLYNFWHGQEENLGFWVWMKNIFVPMYGQSDWTGRLISFFVRLVQIIARGLALLFWLVVVLVVLIGWLALPLFAAFALIWQFLK